MDKVKEICATPRIPRGLVQRFIERPEHTKTYLFIYSYASKSVREGRFTKKDGDNIYRGIQIPLKDVRRWLGPHRSRQEKKINELNGTNEPGKRKIVFTFTQKHLLVDMIIIKHEMNYLAELSRDEAKLTNSQLLFLKRMQAGSRSTQVFNMSTLIEFRRMNDTRDRQVKQKVLADLKLFHEMNMLKKLEFLDGGRQVKVMFWKEQKAGVGRRMKKSSMAKKVA